MSYTKTVLKIVTIDHIIMEHSSYLRLILTASCMGGEVQLFKPFAEETAESLCDSVTHPSI